jgi:hypothetical protein
MFIEQPLTLISGGQCLSAAGSYGYAVLDQAGVFVDDIAEMHPCGRS